MAQINFSNIHNKVLKYINSPEGQREYGVILAKVGIKGAVIDNSSTVIANKFIETMIKSASSCAGSSYADGQLGGSAIAAISNFKAGTPSSDVNDGVITVSIPFYFDGSLSRPSLEPALYSGVDNIIAVLNNGYSASGAVLGYWKDHITYSLKNREGTHFIQDAVAQFIARYGKQYDIVSIDINEKYE